VYKVGIIGFGKIGQLRARLVDSQPDLIIDSICEIDLRGISQKVIYPCFSDYHEVIERKPDIVFVCTSNDKLAEVVIAAMDAGCHVFSEKPPGRTIEDVEAMIAAEARNPQLKLKFGFNHRYHESVRQAQKLVEGNRFGKILSVHGVYGKSGAVDYEEQWRNNRQISGGGILLDQGIHMLDLMLLFCHSFNEVHSFVDNLFWNIDVEDNAFALLRNEKKQVGILTSSATQWKHTFNLDVVLEEGYLSLRGILSKSMSYGRESLVVARKSFAPEKMGNPDEQVYFFDQDRSWELEIDEFTDCILNDRPVQIGTSLDALKVMKMIYKIYHADPSWASRYLESRS
jgi:predicted dehydrogenase